MRTMFFPAAALLALAGCTTEPEEEAGGSNRMEPPINAEAPPVPAPSPQASPSPAPTATPSPLPTEKMGRHLPPADAEFRYIGRWAANTELCLGGAWEFTERRLSTAGEVTCDFRNVEPVPGGYDIAATCHAEGATNPETIRLRFAESAKAMMVEATGTLNPVGLIWCDG